MPKLIVKLPKLIVKSPKLIVKMPKLIVKSPKLIVKFLSTNWFWPGTVWHNFYKKLIWA